MAEKSKGVALLLSTFFGMFGIDKFYVGATGQGVTILILTLIIIGIPISSIWASLSSLTLLLTILFGIGTFLYPPVNWAPTTKFDKNVAYVMLLIFDSRVFFCRAPSSPRVEVVSLIALSMILIAS